MGMRLVVRLLLFLGATATAAPDCAISQPMKTAGRNVPRHSANCYWTGQAILSHEAVSTVEQSECPLGTVDEIEPADAIREPISGRDAWIFSETLMHHWDAAAVETADAVLIMSGFEVWGRGAREDRPASVDWLRRAADKGYAPAMLAPGTALSGPDVIQDGTTTVGEPPPIDELTDRVQACYWLFSAGDAADSAVASAGQMYFGMNWERMSRKDTAECKELLRSEQGRS